MNKKYVAIYDLDHNHIANITGVVEDINLKVYEFDNAKFTGYSKIDVASGAYGLFNDGKGKLQYAGLLRDVKQEDDGKISFKLDDFRKIFDTQILLDFSQSTPDHSLDAMFEKVMSVLTSTADTMNLKIDISYTIPTDSTSTIGIANYTHEYLIENAWKFLKVYLSYYQYYVSAKFNPVLQRIEIEFVKNTTTTKVKLNDVLFEKNSSGPKTNKTIATIKYEKNTTSGENEWGSSTSTYWNNQDAENRDSGETLPDPTGYQVGFAFKKVTYSGVTWVSASITEYNNASNRQTKSIQIVATACPTHPPLASEVEAAAGSPSSYPDGTVIRGAYYWVDADIFGLCTNYTYIKKVANVNNSYYQITSTIVYEPRPNLVDKVYILGNNNQIYSGYPSDSLRIYPVKQKMFEAAYLSEAQFKAVLELVESRYNENIIIKDIRSPIDLETIELYTFIDVYDKDGTVKTLPVSEKRRQDDHYTIKLGFKKQFFTEIVKSKEE